METVIKCCFMCWIKYSDRKKSYFCAIVFRAPATWSWGKAVHTLRRRPSVRCTVRRVSGTWGFSWNAHKKPFRFLSHFHTFGKQINSLKSDS